MTYSWNTMKHIAGMGASRERRRRKALAKKVKIYNKAHLWLLFSEPSVLRGKQIKNKR